MAKITGKKRKITIASEVKINGFFFQSYFRPEKVPLKTTKDQHSDYWKRHHFHRCKQFFRMQKFKEYYT